MHELTLIFIRLKDGYGAGYLQSLKAMPHKSPHYLQRGEYNLTGRGPERPTLIK